MFATNHITRKDMAILRSWSSILPGMPMLAEYSATRLVPSRKTMTSISGPSNTFT
jgi:hypothetical protein